jgi:hypothetical protein
MSGWVRLWEDMPTDPKWRVVARKSGQPVPSVIAVFTMLMVEGGKAGRTGDVSGARIEDIAAALDMDDESVAAIMDAMQGRVIEGGALSGWEKRQPKREDNSTQRVQAHRERHKTDAKRDETQCNAAEAEAEAEKNISDAIASGAEAPPAPAYTDARHELWGEGKPILLSLGVPERQCGQLIGKWLKATGDDAPGVLDAIQRAREARPHEPIPWITRALPTKANRHGRIDDNRSARRPSGTEQAITALADAVHRRSGGGLAPDDPGAFRPDGPPAPDCPGDAFALGPPPRAGIVR